MHRSSLPYMHARRCGSSRIDRSCLFFERVPPPGQCACAVSIFCRLCMGWGRLGKQMHTPAQKGRCFVRMRSCWCSRCKKDCMKGHPPGSPGRVSAPVMEFCLGMGGRITVLRTNRRGWHAPSAVLMMLGLVRSPGSGAHMGAAWRERCDSDAILATLCLTASLNCEMALNFGDGDCDHARWDGGMGGGQGCGGFSRDLRAVL